MSRYIPTKKRQFMLGSSEQPDMISVYFHANNILKIQDALGKKCTFVSHVRYPSINKYALVAKFGKKEEPLVAELNGTPNDIKAENYAQLKNDLTNAARQRGLI